MKGICFVVSLVLCSISMGQTPLMLPPTGMSQLSTEECDALQGLINLCDLAITAQTAKVDQAYREWDEAVDKAGDAYSELMQSYMAIPYNPAATDALRLKWMAAAAQESVKLEAWNYERYVKSMMELLRFVYQQEFTDGGC